MESFDSPGSVLPVRAAEQDIVSKKISDKDGQGQGPPRQYQKRTALEHPPREDEDEQTEKHAIDIVV